MRWFTTAADKVALSALIMDATRAFVADRQQSAEAYSWFRNNRDDIDRHRDGPTLDAQGLDPLTLTVAKLLPAVGSTVRAVLPNATRLDLVVGGIYRANQVIGTLVVPLDTYTAAGGSALDQFVYVDLAPGADAGAARAALDGVLAAYPVVTLKDQAQFREELKAQVSQLLLLVDALLALSVLIAVLGIGNTLALAVIERTREIGLLRAVGMGRPQRRRMVRLESVVISLYGAALGLVLGVVLGLSLTRALSGQGIEVLAVPVARLALFLVLAAVIGVLAALWPARRAARLQNDLSFTVAAGQVTGFLGPNGSGKSTTMRMIVGLDTPSSGTVTVGGKRYGELRFPLHEVGALLDANAAHPGRSARNHLLWLADANAIPRRRVDEALAAVGLTEVAHRRAGAFSLGMGQRLGIAAALLGDPEVLIFDEPINGLDPEGILWVRGLLRSLADEGRTVLVSSHLMSEMALTADHLIVIGRGRLLSTGSVADFIERSAGHHVLDPTSTLTLDGAVSDAIEVTNYLRDRFDQNKIYVLGNSWGTILGVLAVQAHPELYRAFIGAGQMVSIRETDRIFYTDTLTWARRTGNTPLADTLTASGPPPYADIHEYEAALLTHENDVYPYDHSPNDEGAGGYSTKIFVREYSLMEQLHNGAATRRADEENDHPRHVRAPAPVRATGTVCHGDGRHRAGPDTTRGMTET